MNVDTAKLPASDSGELSSPDAASRYRGRIIDVHMHAYPMSWIIDPTWANPVTGQPGTVDSGRSHLQACLDQMDQANIVLGVVSGGAGDRLGAVAEWRAIAPDIFLGGAGVRGSAEVPLPELQELRTAFEDGSLSVLGEVTAQYAGRTLSDPVYEPYLALAEELNVPVAVHTGIGPAGTSFDPCCRGFRASLGNPLLLEEALNKHPRLRLSVMHAGWPYLQEMIALMVVYPQVYADLGSLNWYFPLAEYHAYLGALMRAGLGRRLMFGSDQMYWPEAIGAAVEATQSAPFLTADEKRDIFHDNAVRFLELQGSR